MAHSDPIMAMTMTAHPGRVKALVDVPFERARNFLELRSRPPYGEMLYTTWHPLRDALKRAHGPELQEDDTDGDVDLPDPTSTRAVM